MSSTEVAGLDWSTGKLLPAFQTPQELTVYDIRRASTETKISVTTFVGLINRPRPQVYLFMNDDDVFWLDTVFNSVPHTTSANDNDTVLDALLDSYARCLQGMVIYDPALPDSINIATTIAGQRDALVVSPVQARRLQSTRQYKVLEDLRTYRWKSRGAAYEWALRNLRSGASSRLVAGLDPKNAGGLRSFLTATRTFVYWLDARNVVPYHMNGLRSEHALMKQILNSFPAGAVHLGWFQNESSGVSLTSEVGLPVLASDHFFNLEVWTSLQEVSTPKPTPRAIPQIDSSKVYVSFTISDGDNIQFSQHHMRRLWNDPTRGSIPIGWTISPMLGQDMPALAAYYMNSASPNDELVAGPSGAGYMFPSRWPSERLPAFLQQTGQAMQQMGITTIELLDADLFQRSGIPLVVYVGGTFMAVTDDSLHKQFASALQPYGLTGILHGAGKRRDRLAFSGNGVPIYRNLGLARNVRHTIRLIKNATMAHRKRPLFLNVYILAWTMNPSMLKQVVQQLGDTYEFVTPSVLLSMLSQTHRKV
ncbi:MAG TPA: GxGYxYP domain-containing protein [Ktedonobacteraceae bacterium]|nr:GxGYxYP domain-containing protein [Ktedonobacteraceae bacterium]